MREAMWTVATIAGLIGAVVGYAVGAAVARARRAWADFIATKDAIKGLFRLSISQWVYAAKVAAVACLLTAVVVIGLVIR